MTGKSEPVPVHPLKNQLTIILGLADLLIRDSGANDRCREKALEIRKSATAALELLVESATQAEANPL